MAGLYNVIFGRNAYPPLLLATIGQALARRRRVASRIRVRVGIKGDMPAALPMGN